MSAVTVSQETIDPAMAAKLLATNTRNRGIKTQLLQAIERDISEGHWMFNGESIKIAEDGTLIDGQHRLKAVVAAGKSIETVVIRGLDPATQSTVDTGARRSFGDQLKLAGEHYYTSLAALTRTSWNMDTTGSTNPGRVSPTVSEMTAYLSKNPGLREWAQLAAQASRSSIKWPPSLMGIGYQMSRIDDARAKEFWRQLLENDAPKGGPIFRLREQLIKDRLAAHPASVTHRAALMIKAWNNWVSGRDIQQLTWRPGIEDFPKLQAPTK